MKTLEASISSVYSDTQPLFSTLQESRGNLWKPLGIAGVVLLMSLFAGIGVGVYVGLHPDSLLDPPNPTEPLPPSESPLGVYNDAAVAANCYPCNLVGRDVLMEGGNAVDAAIATLFCDGVACLQSMGLGGGFVMTIYNKTTGEAHTINAREHAPAAAFEDMFEGNSTMSQKGALAVAIPGELKGYWEVYKRFGSLSWDRLILPTIQMCEEGFPVGRYVAKKIQEKADDILESESLREILTDENGNLLEEGDLMFRPRLAETLRTIALEGGDALYTGSLANILVEDIQSMGGIITAEDMANFEPRWQTPIKVELSGAQTAYTLPAPSSGPLVAFMLNVLDGFIPAADDITTHQRVVETMKYAYGMRTRLGDPLFVDIEELLTNLTSKDYALYIRSQITDGMTFDDPAHYGAQTLPSENHGTAHVSVIASDGSAVSVTSTINLLFGAKVRSMRTGIILNDEMDDFSAPNITNAFGVPPSPENFIVPGKIPLSSMSSLIVVNAAGDAILVVGASGGTKISSAVPQVAIKNLWLNHTIKEAIDAPRMHHQIYPMELVYEYGILDNIVEGLESIGHVTDRFNGGSSVCGVARDGNFITANSDYRRDAVVGGF